MLRLIAPMAALFLLLGISFDDASRQEAPPGAENYHASIKTAVESIPYLIGDWVGIDTEIRQEALRILDANVTLSRTYRHMGTGRIATLLLVHCSDSRSLLGHYPPVCYPSQGWTQLASAPRNVETDSMAVLGTEYTFTHGTLSQSARLGVLHFTVLPDGRTAPDMGLLEFITRDKKAKYFGGASLQLIVDAGLSDTKRDEIYKLLLQATSEWIRLVQSGISI